jgi:chondroitin 4-sulfotransferase 11
MRISHKHKFVFIAISKTASVTIRTLLNQYSDIRYGNFSNKNPHITARDVKKELFVNDTKKFNSYFKFAFVRNPWERMVSWYEFMCKQVHKIESEKYNNVATNYAPYKKMCLLGFDGYIRFQHEKKNSGFFGYERYYSDKNGNNLLDFIGKLENLQEDFNTICDKIGIPRKQLPHKNKTKHKHYTEYYDEETKHIVAERYAKDIEYFGYEFGE